MTRVVEPVGSKDWTFTLLMLPAAKLPLLWVAVSAALVLLDVSAEMVVVGWSVAADANSDETTVARRVSRETKLRTVGALVPCNERRDYGTQARDAGRVRRCGAR